MQHFYRNASIERTNSLDLWENQRKIQSASVTHTSWDYRRAATDAASESSWIDNGESAPQLEDYRPIRLRSWPLNLTQSGNLTAFFRMNSLVNVQCVPTLNTPNNF